MKKSTLRLVQMSVIAALYVVLTYAQELLVPGSATWAIQFRASEALCVLAFFTPSAIPGLTVGCLLFNLSSAGALPLDWLIGSLATLAAAALMYLTRKKRFFRLPPVGILFPALTNGLLVGWELTYYMGGGFPVNALCVAAGEAAVLITLGSALYYAILSRGLQTRFFN